MDSRTLFLDACRRAPVPRPPVWLMRQVGRYMARYQELRKRVSFAELLARADLAAECSLYVLDDFDPDAVIVFSDMDPMGLQIALTMPHADYWLGPEQMAWRSCLQSKLANREGFDLQDGALAYLQQLSDQLTLTRVLHELLMCFRQERSSYRQEHMYSQRVGLALFSVTR